MQTKYATTLVQKLFTESFIGGPDGLDNPAIDGFFFDDNYNSRTGASEEDGHNIEDCGLSPDEALAVEGGWKVACVVWREDGRWHIHYMFILVLNVAWYVSVGANMFTNV